MTDLDDEIARRIDAAIRAALEAQGTVIADLAAHLSGTDQRVTALEERVDALKADIRNLDARLMVLEGAQPEPEPEPEPEPGAWNPLDPPFAPSSIWNTPLPADTQPHARSAEWVPTFVSIDPTQYTYPVYIEPPEGWPVWEITCTGAAKMYDGTEAKDVVGKALFVPLPDDFAIPAGSDGQIIVIELDGSENDLWQVRDVDRGNRTARASNGSQYEGAMSGPGTTSPIVYASRGAGVPYFAGLIRPHEMAAGRIPHALAFAYDRSGSDFVYPATKSDGNDVGGMPEGGRVYIPADTDIASLKDRNGKPLTAEARIVARALQEFGAVLVDNAGNSGKLYAESVITADWPTLPNANWVRFRSEDLRVADWGGDGVPGTTSGGPTFGG